MGALLVSPSRPYQPPVGTVPAAASQGDAREHQRCAGLSSSPIRIIRMWCLWTRSTAKPSNHIVCWSLPTRLSGSGLTVGSFSQPRKDFSFAPCAEIISRDGAIPKLRTQWVVRNCRSSIWSCCGSFWPEQGRSLAYRLTPQNPHKAIAPLDEQSATYLATVAGTL